MSESIGCCGSHIECQTTGICTCDRNVDCALYHSTVKHKFDTLYKLKELGLVEPESNHLTDKGDDYLKKKIGQLPMAVLLLLILQIQGETTSSRLDVRKTKSLLRVLTNKYKE